MDNWDDLKFFLAVHKTGTMVSAAKILGTNVATVSRRVERLNAEVGTAVFVKSAGHWQLNPSVQGLLRITEDFEGRLANELNWISNRNGSLATTRLKIGAPPLITDRVLAPRIGEAFENHPNYSIELHDRPSGGGLNDVDILIRAGRPEHGRLVTKRIGDIDFRLYGHKDGTRKTAWVGLTQASEDMAHMRYARDYFGHEPSLRATQVMSLYQLVKATRLSAALPVFMAAADPDLYPLEPEADPISIDIWIAYHNSRRTDPAIQRTVQWVSGCFKNLVKQAELEPASNTF